MAAAQFIAQILGPLYLVATLGWLFNRAFYRRMISEFSQNHAVLYMSGIFAFVFGVVILTLHNSWTANWQVLITLIGWAGLIKGLTILVFPQAMIRYGQAFATNKVLFTLTFLLAFLIGLVLTWYGYFA